MNIFNSSVHKISENLKGQSIALHVLDEKVLFFCFFFGDENDSIDFCLMRICGVRMRRWGWC